MVGCKDDASNYVIFSGMWARDSDDEDERPGFGSSSKKKSDFTAPIGFVSGGIKQGDKTVKQEDEVC